MEAQKLKVEADHAGVSLGLIPATDTSHGESCSVDTDLSGRGGDNKRLQLTRFIKRAETDLSSNLMLNHS